MKSAWRQRPNAALFLLVSYFMWAAVSVRWILFIQQDQGSLALLSALLILFGMLMGLEPVLTHGSRWRAHVYLTVQTMLVFIASLFYFEIDFFAILYLPLCGQAVYLFPRRAALIWVGILVVCDAVGQINQFGWPEALSFILLYTAGLVFVAAFSTITLQAESARRESDSLLARLTEAHIQLQAYAGQAEELAIAKERNRLARELHDSVAQALYGMNLQAEAAARKLIAGQTDAVMADLRDIQESSHQSLQETRLLIYELRPPLLDETGLAAALNARLDAVESRSGLRIVNEMEDVGRLPAQIEVGLYRIAQEALNNVVKHAAASEVRVSLTRIDSHIVLEISDNGSGFEPENAAGSGGLGLAGMAERAALVGGALAVTSASGQGTTIRAETPL
ncbi:MAG: sensor histidine kinase [Caldilineales bacterium]|nr:sensor histidine kinase [Caldilineales bacterium]